MVFKEITLNTASLLRTRLFYHRTLELPIVYENEETITFKAGDTKLTFKQAAGSKPVYHIAFNITNNKFSDSFEWINSKLDILTGENGLPIFAYNDWNAESFYFYDNNGNVLEFIVRFDLPYHSNEPFSSCDIRQISEVGIVTDDVLRTADELHAKYGIPYFAKSVSSGNFSAMGDDYGLLIVVATGHHWIPTHKPAAKYPLSISFINPDNEGEETIVI